MLNISDKPLTTDEGKLLANWPNYAIVPKDPPITQYVASSRTCMYQVRRREGRGVQSSSKGGYPKKKETQTQHNKGERRAIAELKKDPSRMVLTADKGVALVVMSTEDCKKKAEELLNQKTYRALTSDPTMRLKNKMINTLKSTKTKGGMTEELYKRLYPTGAGSPKFYGLPKIHKPGMPLRLSTTKQPKRWPGS